MENNKDWITNRYENVRTFEDMINLFTGEEENMILMTKYKQICEAYMLYLSMQKFEDAIQDYIKSGFVEIINWRGKKRNTKYNE